MFVDTKEETAFLDLSKPSLAALSHILRRRELWPAGFEWNYAGCPTCAMGMSDRLWGLSMTPLIGNAWFVMQIFDIDYYNIGRIFLGEAFTKGEYSTVTPERVADEIDEYLAKG